MSQCESCSLKVKTDLSFYAECLMKHARYMRCKVLTTFNQLVKVFDEYFHFDCMACCFLARHFAVIFLFCLVFIAVRRDWHIVWPFQSLSFIFLISVFGHKTSCCSSDKLFLACFLITHVRWSSSSSVFDSEVPHELIQQARGGEVNLNLEDHRNEDYVKPRTVVRAFTGEGHRLGWYARLSWMLTVCKVWEGYTKYIETPWVIFIIRLTPGLYAEIQSWFIEFSVCINFFRWH